MADKAPGDDEFEKMIRERRATYRSFVNRMTRQQQAPAPPPEIRYDFLPPPQPPYKPPPTPSQGYVREGEFSAEEYTAYNLRPLNTEPGHRQKRDTYWSAQDIAKRHEVERYTPR